MSSAQAEFDALARSLGAIADPAIRVAYVRHALRNCQPDQGADLFTLAMTSAEGRRSAHVELLQALSLALADDSCDGLREAVRAVLEARQQFSLARALTRAIATEDAETQRIPDFGTGRTVTLGERKSLARSHDRELIARCLRDPHPGVVRILLGNPIVTETDVVRVCARRPASTEVLREVFRSPRFIVRYPVKVALVLNPYTPVDIGLQLAPLLQAQDLRRLSVANDVSEELREACRRIMGSTDSTVLH
jgi:hypothetical protein